MTHEDQLIGLIPFSPGPFSQVDLSPFLRQLIGLIPFAQTFPHSGHVADSRFALDGDTADLHPMQPGASFEITINGGQ